MDSMESMIGRESSYEGARTLFQTSKYNNNEFNKFVFILNELKEKSKYDKTEFIELVKLVYALNPDGKGKVRKRTLSEVVSIIQNKKLN